MYSQSGNLIASDGQDPTTHYVDATASQRYRPLLEPSKKIRSQPTVPPVFLDQMLENHGSNGVFRDSFALLRVSCEPPCDHGSEPDQVPFPGTRP